MGIFDSLVDGREQKKAVEAERRTADAAAREEYRQRIMTSDLMKDLLATLDQARDDSELSWIALAEDYYDHDPREVSVAKDGDSIRLQRVRYYDEEDVFRIPTNAGGFIERKALVHKCEVVRNIDYGFVKSGYLPIDAPRMIKTSTGEHITFEVKDIRSIVETIIYSRLAQLFPQCEFKGRVVHRVGCTESFGPKLVTYNDLTYFVPSRKYRVWY